MSLFKSVEKWKKESKESVVVKQKFDKHVATYPAARANFDKERPEVIRLTAELNAVLQAEGRSPRYKELEKELRAARLKRDRSLVQYGSVKHDLELELYKLVYPFITEEAERWEDETLKIRSEVVHQEQPKEKDEPGTFSMGGPHKISSNKKAISSFREKSQENLNHLRDMVHSSIPEIEQFIEKAETEMRAIDLTPVVIEMDGKEFQHDRADSAKEPGRMASGFVPPTGPGVEIKNPGESDKQNAQLISDLDRAKMIFKPILPK